MCAANANFTPTVVDYGYGIGSGFDSSFRFCYRPHADTEVLITVAKMINKSRCGGRVLILTNAEGFMATFVRPFVRPSVHFSTPPD